MFDYNMMRYFCHSCQVEVEGRIAQESEEQEPECVECGSHFIEKVGQNVEEFLALPQSTSATSTVSTSSNPPTASEIQTSESSSETTSSFQTPMPLVMLQLAGGRTMPLNLQTHNGTSLTGPQPTQDLLSLLLRGTGLLHSDTDFAGGGGSIDDVLHQLFMNEQGTIATPTSPETIAALERERDSDKLRELGECGITLEPYEPGDVALVLPCRHSFKEEAILQWLQTHDTCPGMIVILCPMPLI